MSAPLTPFRLRALAALRDATDTPSRGQSRGHTGRSLALTLWPDSPAWQKRTRGRDTRNGAMGGTMPMKGARVGWDLARDGYALIEHTRSNQTIFLISAAGRVVLEAAEAVDNSSTELSTGS